MLEPVEKMLSFYVEVHQLEILKLQNGHTHMYADLDRHPMVAGE